MFHQQNGQTSWDAGPESVRDLHDAAQRGHGHLDAAGPAIATGEHDEEAETYGMLMYDV